MSPPYNSTMRVGMGYNSFTQETCARDVVKPALATSKPNNITLAAQSTKPLDQVHSSAQFVSRFGDLLEAFGVTPAAYIKNDGSRAAEYAQFLNVDHFNGHHIHYLIRVLAAREVPCSPELIEFDVISAAAAEPAKVYGDSFITGFLEGGELVALISVKLRRPSEENIAVGKCRLEGQVGLVFRVATAATAAGEVDGETTTIVWRKCGLGMDAPNQWTPQSVREEVMSFPKNAFANPVRLGPVLSKYTTLKSFLTSKIKVPEYEKSGAYIRAASLLEDYLEYKGVWGSIHIAALQVEAGHFSLTPQPQSPELLQLSSEAKAESEAVFSDYEDVRSSKSSSSVIATNEGRPYAATVLGLTKARRDCEREMLKIIDSLAANPEANAEDPSRQHLNPTVFRMLVPRITDIAKQQLELDTTQQLEKSLRAEAELQQKYAKLELTKNDVARELQDVKKKIEPYRGWCPIELDKPFRLVNVATTRSMDYDFTNSNGPSYQLHTWDQEKDNSNQKFEVVLGDAKGYYIRHVVSGRYLTPTWTSDVGVHMDFYDNFPFPFTFNRIDADNRARQVY
ncbi:hypothetical protein MKEN_00860400 [Mycena kentingensis (nom. inval.)]|nr:hypothetical protein MKEN_00860400 [Mycena kentingensis (nom. inval.)]